MKSVFLGFVIVSLMALNTAHALCVNGTTVRCTDARGKIGTKTCVNYQFGPCEVNEEPEQPPLSGTLQPKYKILTVIYAPPGTQGGGSTSSVSYGSGSTAGTTVSASKSFKQEYKISVKSEAGFLGTGGSVGASFGYARNASNDKSLDITKTAATEINHAGPAVDGVDHDRDQIWLWLNPSIRLSLTPAGVEWTLDGGRPADIQYVYVGHLKDPAQMPPGVAQRLQAYGITTQDYAEILKADPFTNPIQIDTNRFKSLNTTFPYEPPYAEGDPVPTYSFKATYASTDTSSSSVENEYSVGLTVSGGLDFIKVAKISFENENSWTWTDTKTTTASTGAEESAAVTIGGPAFGYSGPTDMAIYYDTLYKTFLFAPIDGTLKLALRGLVKSRSKKAISGKEVILMANGVKYRTFTNAKGEYRIFGKISGPLQLQVDGVKKRLSTRRPPKKANIVLP